MRRSSFPNADRRKTARHAPKAAEFAATIKYARKRYGKRKGVLAITLGTKFVAGKPTQKRVCIQFLVRKKLDRKRLGDRNLPKYVLKRGKYGSADPSIRIETDVIEVGTIFAACGSGSKTRFQTLRGTATLYFRNKAPADNTHYLLTCAHNIGNLTQQHPTTNKVKSSCDLTIAPFAKTVASAVIAGGTLKFDVALARVEPAAIPLIRDLEIDRIPTGTTTKRITGLMPRSGILPNLPVKVAFGVSKPRKTTVESFAGEVPVTYQSGVAEVGNAFLLNTGVSGGDSGSLIYDDQGLGIGIVFARSTTGLGWFHPLADAVSFLSTLLGKSVVIV